MPNHLIISTKFQIPNTKMNQSVYLDEIKLDQMVDQDQIVDQDHIIQSIESIKSVESISSNG